ncbi:MAG: hypothetical protein ACRD0R_07305 [Acidimicrobiales bacterium]
MASEQGAIGSRPPASSVRETEWISWLFTIGSACFAVASIPMLAAAVPDDVIGTTYFVGALFFTTASVLVAATTWRDIAARERSGSPVRALRKSIDWWAAMIQVAGTLWFNVNTYNAMLDGLTTQEQNLRVWTPDFLGSVCFLVSSYLSWWSFCHRPWCLCRDMRAWQIAAFNLAGSLFFMAAALAAFVLPSTGDALDASLANSATLTGALCFLIGARLLTRTDIETPGDSL